MNFQGFLVILSALCVLITAENKDTKHEQNHLHEKSHQSKIPQQKHHNRQHILNRNKHSKSENQRSHHVSNFIYRDANEKCSWVCLAENGKSSSNSLKLQGEYNGNASLIGIVSKSSNIALVVDGDNNVTAIINEQSGVVIVIDNNSKSAYRLLNTQEVDLRSGFDTYFQNLSSLQTLLDAGKQSPEKYNFSSIDPSILGDLTSLGLSSSSSSDELNQIALFTSQCQFLYQNKGSFNISKNLEWFLNLNLVLAKLLDNQERPHIQLDLDSVFDSSSGIEALLSLLSQVGKHEDLSKLLSKYLTSPKDLLCLIFDVSKGSNDGLDGLITILAKIIGVITGKSSVSDVTMSLMSYNPVSQGKSSNLSQIISETLDLIRSQNKSFQNFPAFKAIFNILTSLNNNNLMWNHVNISDLIKLLQFKNPREIVQTVIRMITFASSQGIPRLLNYIRSMPALTNNLQSIFKGIINQLSSNANVTGFLSRFPVLGDFIHNISSHFGNEFDIGHYLNSSSILGNFNNLLKGNSHHGPIGNLIDTVTNGISKVESGVEHGVGGILGSGSDNSHHGLIGNIIGTVTNGISKVGSGVEHGVGGILSSVTGGILGSGSGHGDTTGAPSENPSTSDGVPTFTGGLHLDGSSSGYGQISNRKISHGKHNLHEEKENKLHHSSQDRKLQHEH